MQTVFRGDMLRSMLLNAYGFWKMGQIAMVGAFSFFAIPAAPAFQRRVTRA